MAFAIQQDLPSARRASVALAADRDASVAAASSEPASSQVQVGHKQTSEATHFSALTPSSHCDIKS